MFRSVVVRLLAGIVCAGSLAVAGASSATASQAHPESTRILPRLFYTAGAVDGAGGSLVAGVHITSGTDTFDTYYRSSSGRWGKRVEIPVPAGQNTGYLQDVDVIGGTSGFFVIAWVYSDVKDTGEGPPEFSSPVVYAATRLPSGTITTPKRLFETDDYPKISLAGNANGDAALTMDGGDDAARYVRGVGWSPLAVPVEAGDATRGAAVAHMSAAGTVDITYVSPRYAFDADTHAHIVQQTLPADSQAFSRRDLYSAPDTFEPDFDIAMDSAGLQTLVTADEDDGIKVYREDTRRGHFDYLWRKPNGYRTEDYQPPQVESSGHYTRVTWSTRSALLKQTRWTRAFNGTNWGPSARGAAYRSQLQPFRLAIASDGTGVEVGGVEADTKTGTHDYLLRGYLNRTTRDDALAERKSFYVDDVDGNAGGVSQRIDVEQVRVGGEQVDRTVARIRR